MKVVNGIIIISYISFFNMVGYTNTNGINNHLIKWEYQKNINIEGNKKYKNIFLDKDVYRYTQDNFSDIRIVDDQKSFTPYFIVNSYIKQKRKKIKYRTKRINTFKDKRGDSYFDFQIFPPGNNA